MTVLTKIEPIPSNNSNDEQPLTPISPSAAHSAHKDRPSNNNFLLILGAALTTISNIHYLKANTDNHKVKKVH